MTFEELVRLIAASVSSRAKVLHLNPGLALLFSRLAGYLVRDVVLTRDEIDGLMEELLVTQGPATGQTRLSEWLVHDSSALGAGYASELSRHYR
jgi:NADH dehydrogenase